MLYRPLNLMHKLISPLQDLRIYVSDHEKFTKFNESQYLFWELSDLEYGDWVSGPSGDGSFVLSDFVEISEVCMTLLKIGQLGLRVTVTPCVIIWKKGCGYEEKKRS